MTQKIFPLTLTLALLSACTLPTSDVSAIAAPNYATASLDLSTPENTATSMMIAMYRGNTDMIDAIFMEGGTLSRLRPDGTLTRDGLPRWRDWVGTLETGFAHEELFDIKVEEYGKLASVWAPFVIDVDGKRVGCGVNHFTMAQIDGDWRIVSGMDIQAPKEDCADFRDTYRRGK